MKISYQKNKHGSKHLMYKFVFNIGSKFFSVQFSSVTQQCLTLCDPMDWSRPGFPRLLPTPKICSNSCASSQWCHSTISSSVIPFSSCLQSLPASGSFPMSQFSSGGRSIVVSASASVLPMNIQEWILRIPLSHAILVSVFRLSLLAIN